MAVFFSRKALLAYGVLSAGILAGGSAALASTTSSVGSPNVKKGEAEIAVRAGYSIDKDNPREDERFRTRAHIKYGFTDTYAVQIVVSQDKRQGDSYEHDGIKFENRFHLIKKADHGFDFGIRANYALKDGDKKPDSVELGFYGLVPLDAYELRLNQIFSHEVGQEAVSGVGGETRFQVTRAIAENHRLGVEGFHDFGNFSESSEYAEQSHMIGPVVKGKFLDGYSYEAGYRAGISDAAPDHNFKVFLSKTF